MKIDKEKRVVFLMIDIYYKKNKNNNVECEKLKEYVMFRLEKCPFGEKKKFCSNCNIHCYQKDMREQIQKVMRYSGPRMIIYHPIIAVKHIIESRKEKKHG